MDKFHNGEFHDLYYDYLTKEGKMPKDTQLASGK
jgi:hypothetical protein